METLRPHRDEVEGRRASGGLRRRKKRARRLPIEGGEQARTADVDEARIERGSIIGLGEQERVRGLAIVQGWPFAVGADGQDGR